MTRLQGRHRTDQVVGVSPPSSTGPRRPSPAEADKKTPFAPACRRPGLGGRGQAVPDQDVLHPHLRLLPVEVEQFARGLDDPLEAGNEGHHDADVGSALDHQHAAKHEYCEHAKVPPEIVEELGEELHRVEPDTDCVYLPDQVLESVGPLFLAVTLVDDDALAEFCLLYTSDAADE